MIVLSPMVARKIFRILLIYQIIAYVLAIPLMPYMANAQAQAQPISNMPFPCFTQDELWGMIVLGESLGFVIPFGLLFMYILFEVFTPFSRVFGTIFSIFLQNSAMMVIGLFVLALLFFHGIPKEAIRSVKDIYNLPENSELAECYVPDISILAQSGPIGWRLFGTLFRILHLLPSSTTGWYVPVVMCPAEILKFEEYVKYTSTLFKPL